MPSIAAAVPVPFPIQESSNGGLTIWAGPGPGAGGLTGAAGDAGDSTAALNASPAVPAPLLTRTSFTGPPNILEGLENRASKPTCLGRSYPLAPAQHTLKIQFSVNHQDIRRHPRAQVARLPGQPEDRRRDCSG